MFFNLWSYNARNCENKRTQIKCQPNATSNSICQVLIYSAHLCTAEEKGVHLLTRRIKTSSNPSKYFVCSNRVRNSLKRTKTRRKMEEEKSRIKVRLQFPKCLKHYDWGSYCNSVCVDLKHRGSNATVHQFGSLFVNSPQNKNKI